MRQKIFASVLYLFGLYLIVSLVKDIFILSQKGQEVKKSEIELEQALLEKGELEKRLEYVKTPGFVEKEAREKLGMSKQGETIVVLPTNVEQIMGVKEEAKKEELPNWKKWGQIFGMFK